MGKEGLSQWLPHPQDSKAPETRSSTLQELRIIRRPGLGTVSPFPASQPNPLLAAPHACAHRNPCLGPNCQEITKQKLLLIRSHLYFSFCSIILTNPFISRCNINSRNQLIKHPRGFHQDSNHVCSSPSLQEASVAVIYLFCYLFI